MMFFENRSQNTESTTLTKREKLKQKTLLPLFLLAVAVLVFMLFDVLSGLGVQQKMNTIPSDVQGQVETIQYQLDRWNEVLDEMYENETVDVTSEHGLKAADEYLKSVVGDLMRWYSLSLGKYGEEDELTQSLDELGQYAIDTQYRVTVGLKTEKVPERPDNAVENDGSTDEVQETTPQS